MTDHPRVRALNSLPVRPNEAYVVYWMVAARRLGWNHGLDRAIDHARELGRPLIIFEPLRCGYRWASDRLHAFILQGMLDNRRICATGPVCHYAYVAPEPGAGSGLLATLGERAAVIVTDDFPCFMIPRMQEAAATKVPCRLESVDSNGLLPIRHQGREFTSAHSFRRHLHKALPPHLGDFPAASPLDVIALDTASVPAVVLERWPQARDALLDGSAAELAKLPIDHQVKPVARRGGPVAGAQQLARFVEGRLQGYADQRNPPQAEGSSELSAYLHFGHVGAHQVFAAVADAEQWSPAELAAEPTGKREGWWGMSRGAEAFLDELVTWREIGFNQCVMRDDYDRYESLPEWARQTLEEHAEDPREYVYSLEEFDSAATHDELWNAAQNQLRREGRIHNYLRMLWGKKILHWSASPREALDIMIELNNKYALDGRDPNSYTGIFWVLGRYDRAWGPERKIFGKIRYMTSDSTRRKYPVGVYIDKYRGGPPG